jgi:chromosomal replication initiator protein
MSSNENFPFEHFLSTSFLKNSSDKHGPLTDLLPLDISNHNENKASNFNRLDTAPIEAEELKMLKEAILASLKNKLNPQKYSTFFENSFSVENITADTICFSTTTDFIKNIISKQYMEQLIEAIQEVMGKSMTVEWANKTKIKNTTLSSKAQNQEIIQLNSIDKQAYVEGMTLEKITKSNKFHTIIDSRKTFSNFIVGHSNSFAHAAALSVAKNPGKAYTSLYIHSDSGLGKTHLLHSIANYIQEHYPTLKIHFTSANVFMAEMIEAIQENKIHEFRRRYSEMIDVLIIDDVHELKNKDSTQKEFFDVFNELTNKRKQLIFTSDKHPKDINGIEDRVRTRLSGGMVVEIQRPDLETRTAILKKIAQQEDIFLPDEVIELIAKSIKSNIRELEGSLINLGAYSSIYNLDIDIDIARTQLKLDQYEDKRIIKMEDITKIVSEYFEIPISDLKSQARKKEITHARHVAMYLSNKMIKSSTTTKIAEFYNRKDHTTVVHAVQKIKQLLKDDYQLNNQIQQIQTKL